MYSSYSYLTSALDGGECTNLILIIGPYYCCLWLIYFSVINKYHKRMLQYRIREMSCNEGMRFSRLVLCPMVGNGAAVLILTVVSLDS
jgi:hypothetical protein